MPHQKKLTDEDLMKRIKGSDEKAFGYLYDRWCEPMFLKAYSIVLNRPKAKDIVQEIWIDFWERRHKIKNDNIRGYLFSAVRFKAYNEFRNLKNKQHIIDLFTYFVNQNSSQNNVYEQMDYNATKDLIHNAIESLPKKCKEVFKLSRFEGLKNSEISDKLHISQRTVETHISNALKILRETLTDILLLALALIQFILV